MSEQRRLIYGRRPVQEFLRSGFDSDDVGRAWLQDNLPGSIAGKLREKLPAIKSRTLTRRELNERFPGINHQGVVVELATGVVPDPGPMDYQELLKSHNGLVVILDQMQDVQNVGSIVRSAEFLGAAAVLIAGKGARFTDAAARVASGADLHLPIYHVGNLAGVLRILKKNNYWTVTGVLEDFDDSQEAHRRIKIPELPPAKDLALVVGGEGSGARHLTIKESDFLVSVARRGKTGSLNAAVAAAILMDRLIHRE